MYTIVDVRSGKVVFSSNAEWIVLNMFESWKSIWGEYKIIKS